MYKKEGYKKMQEHGKHFQKLAQKVRRFINKLHFSCLQCVHLSMFCILSYIISDDTYVCLNSMFECNNLEQ